ncbi:metal ABC transporter substrate-binding protein [Sulfurivermis fontis]|uniref:metal ABC transporter substrate-binding protein n=1 Tax=Sulfurivermis fontis TaxID=1972068 RepID=UPI000FDA738A|nr:metal ABC transporter substrate-binding protein [Sulfurivermis fontis]
MPKRLLFVLLLLAALPLQAAPRVVVSVPPLHSLVTALMEGVATPELLLRSESEARADQLTHAQMRLVLQADLLLWSGPEYETALAAALEQTPAAARQAMMMAHHLPLLAALPGSPLAIHGTHHHADGIARDPRFWLDPRLAAIAVHHLTPHLVRLDPDNTERYLDNEIRLLARLRQTEEELRERLAALAGTTVYLKADGAPYFYHRFGLEAAPALQQADLTGAAHGCMIRGSDVLGQHLRSGSELYFRLLARQADDLLNCQPRHAAATATATL